MVAYAGARLAASNLEIPRDTDPASRMEGGLGWVWREGPFLGDGGCVCWRSGSPDDDGLRFVPLTGILLVKDKSKRGTTSKV